MQVYFVTVEAENHFWSTRSRIVWEP